MKLAVTAGLALLLAVGSVQAQAPMESTLPNGEKIRVFPDGRWEYVNQQKADVQRAQREAEEKKKEDARAAAEKQREDARIAAEKQREAIRVAEQKRQQEVAQAQAARDKDAQGIFGAKIYPGDKDFNRGSLNPKLR